VPGGLPTVIYDEEYGARLARAVGLIPYRTWIQDFAGVPALVIERYDRSPDAPQARLHQEDFNQALGASGDEKYQRYGGKASLARIAHLLEQHTGPESREALLRMVVLAAAAGNLDMHAKNISLIHPHEGTVALAPAYDFVPQAHQRNDGEMALAVAGEYCHAHVTRTHLVDEALSWGLTDPEPVIDEVLGTVLETIRREDPHPRAYPRLTADISWFTQNLLDGRAAGLPTASSSR
ncbi:MAG TPA: HipA domain-containing protein, partial [Trueperaceae bacterium]